MEKKENQIKNAKSQKYNKNKEDLKNIKQKLGLVHVITGDGKGKTTSGMGGAVRAKGRGLKVRVIQFFKRDTGEKKTLKKLGIEYFQFKPLHPYFTDYPKEKLENLKKEILTFWKKSIIGLEKKDFLVVDEIGPAINWKVFDEKVLIEFIKNKPKNLELVLTGRDFTEKITSLADYVSEIKPIKHPYQKGIIARKGIEF